MLRTQKKDFVLKLEGVCNLANNIIITHYHGLTVKDLTNLRKSLRKNGVGFQITKNTLSKIAFNNSGLSTLTEMFKGPTAIAFSEDSISAAKGVVEFAKLNDKLKIVGGIVDGKVLGVQEVQALALLPSLDVIRAKIIGLLNAPATKVAGVVQAPAAQLARLVQAYSAK